VSSSLLDLDPAFAPIADWFVRYVREAGYSVVVTSTRRSEKQQAELYAEWKAGARDLPALPPERSLHVRGLAFDMVVSGNYRSQDQRVVGTEWVRLGGTWGAGDPVHFQPPREWLYDVVGPQ
jgi:hypothetical protein